MNYNLRYYQEQGIQEIRNRIAQGQQRIIRQLPTGGGKTIEIKTICEAAARKGKRVGLLAHRQELLEQISRAIDMPHGWIKADKPGAARELIQVASVQTLAKRKHHHHFDLLIVDEAHHSKASQYKQIIAHYGSAHVIGFTATPHRLDGKGFDDIFDSIVLGPSVQELIDGGYLKPAIYYGPPQKIDMKGIKKTAGDYNTGDLAKAVNQSKITGNAIEHYAKHAMGVPAILFGVNRIHIETAADMFNAAGFRFVAVHSAMDRNKVKQALKDLEARRIDGVCSCELISEGVDIPAVSAGIMLRPTQSLSLWLQQVGRCLRPAEGFPHAIVLDHAGNSLAHGFAHDPREWSLYGECDEDGVKRKRKQREMMVKYADCPQCCRIHERGPVCPECGYQYSSENIVAEGMLIELNGDGRLSRQDVLLREEDWKSIWADMVRNGYSQSWARARYRDIYGEEKFATREDRLILPTTASNEDREYLYERWLQRCKDNGHKPGRASRQYQEFFGVWPKGFVERVKERVDYGVDVTQWRKGA